MIKKGTFLNTRLKEKIFNSFLQLHFLYKIIIPTKNNTYKKKSFIDKFLHKLGFWPRNNDAKEWIADRIDPINFTDIDEELIHVINKIVSYTPNKNSKILDLGCSVGRASNLLLKEGR